MASVDTTMAQIEQVLLLNVRVFSSALPPVSRLRTKANKASRQLKR